MEKVSCCLHLVYVGLSGLELVSADLKPTSSVWLLQTKTNKSYLDIWKFSANLGTLGTLGDKSFLISTTLSSTVTIHYLLAFITSNNS